MWKIKTSKTDDLQKELFTSTSANPSKYRMNHAYNQHGEPVPYARMAMPEAYQNAMKELPEGYVDSKYVAPFLPDTQALMNSNNSKAGKKVKKAAATALFLAMAACGHDTPKDMVNISSAINACPYPNGASLQGNTEYAGFGSASFGQRMELGRIERGQTKAVTANLTSNGYLPSTLLLTLDGDYIFNVDMLRNDEFNIQDFLNYFTRGDNPRYDMSTMKIVINPDYWVDNGVTKGTGEKLPNDYAKVVVDSLQEMSNDSSGGDSFTISGIDYNGTHKLDTTVPPDGEMWVFCTTYTNGVSNATYPDNGDKVKSAKILINPHSSIANSGWHEAKDACYQGEQGSGSDNIEGKEEILRSWYRFTFKREAGNGYSLSTTREVRPQSSLMNPSVTYSVTQSMPSMGLLSTPEDDYGHVPSDTSRSRNIDKEQHVPDREIKRNEKK